MDKEVLNVNKQDIDNDLSIRPSRLDEYVGQSEVKDNIDSGKPCLAVINNDAGKHMVAIVGYFTDSNDNIEGYQCINPTPKGGVYEMRCKADFEAYPNYIYVKY